MHTIELKEWDHRCGDGCCYTYGTELWVNGKLVTQNFEGNEHSIQALLGAFDIQATVVDHG